MTRTRHTASVANHLVRRVARGTRVLTLRPERLTRVLVVGTFYLCITTLVLYVYFLGSAVMHAAIRKEAETKFAELSFEVGSLEAEYIKIQAALVPERGAVLGLTTLDDKSFADRTTRVGQNTLSANGF